MVCVLKWLALILGSLLASWLLCALVLAALAAFDWLAEWVGL